MENNLKTPIGRRLIKAGAVGVGVAVIFGVGISIGAGTPPEPTIVTKTVEVPKEVIKEVPGPVQTVEVAKVPASCLHALDNSEALSGHFGSAMDLAAEAIDQAASWDGPGLTATTDKMTKLNKKVTSEVNTYVVNASECRAAQ